MRTAGRKRPTTETLTAVPQVDEQACSAGALEALRPDASSVITMSVVLAMIAGVPLLAGLGGYIAANLPKIRKASADERALQLTRLLEDGFLEYGEGDASLARSIFEDALRVDPRSPEAKAGFALACIEQGDSNGAIEYLDGLGGDASAIWSKATRSLASGKLGREVPTRALTPKDLPQPTAVDLFVFGIIDLKRFHRGDATAAVEAFEHLEAAVLSTPSPPALYLFELGHAAWHAGRPDAARMIAAAIERRWPESPERDFAIGRTLFDANRPAALEAFEKSAHSPPRARDARMLIAKLLRDGEGLVSHARAVSIARELVVP